MACYERRTVERRPSAGDIRHAPVWKHRWPTSVRGDEGSVCTCFGNPTSSRLGTKALTSAFLFFLFWDRFGCRNIV